MFDEDDEIDDVFVEWQQFTTICVHNVSIVFTLETDETDDNDEIDEKFK